MSYRIIVGLLFIVTSTVYAQCDYSSESPCNLDDGCEWVATYQWYDCNNFSSSTQCNNYSEYGCYWDSHWYYTGWSDCDGPSFQLETGGYCQEIEMPDCSELEETSCNHPLYGEGCEWVESDVDCEDLDTESICDSYDCEWTEDVEYGNCSNYSSSWSCSNASDQCGWTLCYGGGYGEWSYCCTGGAFQTDNSYCDGDASYCEEVQYQLGDINGDSSVNILDIIQTIELVLTGDYNYIVDMDLNDSINVLDIIILVELIVSI